LQCGDRRAQPLVLDSESVDRLGEGLGEPLLDLLGMLIDGLAAAAGLLGRPGDGAMAAGEDGGGVEDPGADG
jgi:hypothetical protein